MKDEGTKEDFIITKEDFIMERFERVGNFWLIPKSPTGEHWRWHSVLEILENKPRLDYVFRHATDRTPGVSELFLDFDQKEGEPRKTYTDKVLRACHDLLRRGVEFKLYYTGGRSGYHIEAIMHELNVSDSRIREKIRRKLCRHYGAEEKASDKTPLLIPGRPHRKTGRKKREICRGDVQ